MRFVFESDDEVGSCDACLAADFFQERWGGAAVVEEESGGSATAVVVSADDKYSHLLQILE